MLNAIGYKIVQEYAFPFMKGQKTFAIFHAKEGALLDIYPISEGYYGTIGVGEGIITKRCDTQKEAEEALKKRVLENMTQGSEVASNININGISSYAVHKKKV